MSSTPQSAPQSQTSQCRDLWTKALKKLDDDDKKRIGEIVPSPRSGTKSTVDLFDQLLQAAEDRRQECLIKRWAFEFRERKFVLRDLLDKMIVCINTFKAVGDVAANFDVGHFSLPWAAVRFLLQVSARI